MKTAQGMCGVDRTVGPVLYRCLRITAHQFDHHPIGITYDPVARQVWVACYVGSLIVFNEA